jgi:hypothetical protein
MSHSTIVGGSSASRVIACPGSVELVAKMPPSPSSEHADRGTLLHLAMAEILNGNEEVIGMTYKGIELTDELYDEKIAPALARFSELGGIEYVVESRVDFGNFLPGVFGSADVIGRIDNRAVVLDWKFGDGVMVEAIENKQGLFYAAAARRSKATKWAFAGVTELDIIIVQPPAMKIWRTTIDRVVEFEKELESAVVESRLPDATVQTGPHCRWCNAKTICPRMTGELDRVMQSQLKNVNPEQIGQYLDKIDLLKDWIKDLEGLAFQLLENGIAVPGYKLVAKRAIRKWASQDKAILALTGMGAELSDLFKQELISPAQAEKLLKKPVPEELVSAVSSGSTLAHESDSRPALIHNALATALTKLN